MGGAVGYKQIGISPARYGMVTGDINQDGSVYTSDYDIWAPLAGTANVYNHADLTWMECLYFGYDKWATNSGISHPLNTPVRINMSVEFLNKQLNYSSKHEKIYCFYQIIYLFLDRDRPIAAAFIIQNDQTGQVYHLPARNPDQNQRSTLKSGFCFKALSLVRQGQFSFDNTTLFNNSTDWNISKGLY